MKKAIIFDLNGIFIQSPKLSDRFGEKFGVPTNKFLPVLTKILDIVRRPNAGSLYNYWKSYFKKWKVDLTKKKFYGFWFKAEKENKELVEFVKQLKQKGFKIFILSNNFVERANYYDKKFSFINEIFEKVYYSWQTGFVKPDKRNYEFLLKENNLTAEECIYFDDKNENIIQAQKLGIRSYKYNGLKDFKDKLKFSPYPQYLKRNDRE